MDRVKPATRSPSRQVAKVAILSLALAGRLAAQSDDGAQRIAQSMIPAVERAAGMTFKHPPLIAVRSRDQVRAYLMRKIAAEFPPAELNAMQRTYRVFRLVPDTLDLGKLIVDLYGEQVAGFFDPDSTMLFVVRGSDPQMMRVVMAHELVHALQDQYTHLNAILKLRRQNDRQTAGQAVMEGQAMVASLSALAPGGQIPDFSQIWSTIRENLRTQQASMPVFANAPKILQESMLFPYIAGGEFIQNFEQNRATPSDMPFNNRLPYSTEQIIHFSRYTARERPAAITIRPVPGDTVVYDDDFGEFGARVALESWGVSEGRALAAASGWNGDRYAVFGTRAGTALVWAVAWDSPADAAEFEAALKSGWARSGAGRPDAATRRSTIETIDVRGVKVVRLVDAPTAWVGWRRMPVVRVMGAK